MLRENLNTQRTIFALSSGSLPAAVAIEKISGPEAFQIGSKLFTPHKGGALQRERPMVFGTLKDLNGEKIDDCLALVFLSPNSHTGEDSVEFHCHGSVPIIQKLEKALLELGAQPAQKGEFSYRALLNEKLSAEEIETLGDVYLARSPSELKKVYSRKDGSLALKIEKLRAQLIKVQAVLDTAVDFSEEYASVVSQARLPLTQTIHECSEIIQRYSVFKQGASAPRIVLAGRPNAGKSSLFNGLLGRYRAIVHEEAGTTRDVIEEDIEINGLRCKLVDTAGYREASEIREKEGIEIGENFLSAAAFWILVVDGTIGISSQEEDLIERHGVKPHLILWNKSDLAGWSQPEGKWYESAVIYLSAKSGDGIERVWKELQRQKFFCEVEGPLPTAVESARLERALLQMNSLLDRFDKKELPEYLSEMNREIVRELESVVGTINTDDVLDRVFGDFCIGK